ncbi:Amino acid transporter AVT1C [Labeo rohita]|uniref:Amino acid transporter AVT1C n=1 Tax=Labeo rohita TaxID=84645 RepID=A0ABQ8MWP1_LABRO|nr:Amino acid transporter AVT1C [Labeo rohita]
MAALQAYQAGLLKDLDEDKGLSPEAVEELHHRLNRLLQNGFSAPLLRWWSKSSGRQKRSLLPFRKVIPCHPKSSSNTSGPSRSEDHREDQKSTMATHAPPPSRSREQRE